MITETIQEAIDEDNIIIGTNETVKALKHDSLQRVLLAANAKQETIEDIEYYAELADIEVEHLSQTNEALGNICRKPFHVQTVGLK